MSRTTNALIRAMKGHRSAAPARIEGDFARAIAERLEARGIGRVPGLPVEQPDGLDLLIEHRRRNAEHAAEREARRQAERQAQEKAATPTTSMILTELSRSVARSGPAPIPLNGAQVLRAALNGGSGTVNGNPM